MPLFKHGCESQGECFLSQNVPEINLGNVKNILIL